MESYTLNLKDPKGFIDLFLQHFADKEGAIVLDSCELKGSTYLFLEPYAKVWVENGRSFLAEGDFIKEFPSPWEGLDLIKNFNCTETLVPPIPYSAGFLSYEMLHYIEEIPKPATDPYGMPDALFYIYKKVIELKFPFAGSCTVYSFDKEAPFTPIWRCDVDLSRLARLSQKRRQKPLKPTSTANGMDLLKDLSRKKEYISQVNEIKELIAEGSVYQVNISERFEVDFGLSPRSYYMSLREISPAKFSAFLSLGGDASRRFLVSASPEHFVTITPDKLWCSPIKGTAKRAAASEQLDQKKLQQSPKDLAELSMIVDLVRNDLGKVAKRGSVHVRSHAQIEKLPHLIHLYSEVTATPKDGITPIDTIKALFPCGSITGCPKIASMEVISRLENAKRGAYSGAIGYFATGGYGSFSVAIRTAMIRDSKLLFQSGSGIVYDSDCEAEHAETLLKALPFVSALNAQQKM
ncbi:MAG: anthranilate synthase component I family protein [Candidatus Dadabacteria bacterium]|nr:MAG: anthranilate synthase component I family protein [Candidatus Dadabacteria bacterium]